MDWQSGAAPTVADTATYGFTWVAVGGVLYLSGFSISQTDASGNVLKTFTLNIATGPNVPCIGVGLVVNPFNHHLYMACTNGGANSMIIDVDPAIFEGQADGAVFTIGTDFVALIGPADIQCSESNSALEGLAFSEDFNVLYSVCKRPSTATGESVVNGFAIDPRLGTFLDVIYQSSPYSQGFGVVAGTGCLKDFIYVSNAGGLAQIDSHGIQTQIIEGGIFALTLLADPLDGSLLVPIWQTIGAGGGDILRAVPPQCGGFAGPRRYFAPGLAVGAACTMNSECSTDLCLEDTCALSSYLGHCQTDVDCNDPEAVVADGFWCLLWRNEQPEHHREEHHQEQQHDGEGEGHRNRNRRREQLRARFVEVEEPTDDEDFFPARYGVCILNSCSIGAVCDANADCTPVGDGTHVCKCHEGYYGNGLPGHCANPCLVLNGGCAMGATCTSTSPTDIQCECGSGQAGDGHTCFDDPCIGADHACATDPEAHTAFCVPSDADTYTCECGFGYWSSGGTCLKNACVTSANFCDDHASCTPTGTTDNDATCSCHDGYKNTMTPPQSPTCVAATCIPLSPGTFPLNQIEHSIIGTCVGLVTGQTCQVGCGPGFKPKGSTFTTCTPTPGRPTSYYSVPQFECIPDTQKESSHHGHKDKTPTPAPTPAPAPQAWVCVTGQQCHPAAPLQVLPKRSTSVKLHWYPLQVSPNNDVVSSLVVSILPSGSSVPSFSSPIDNPSFTNSITITGLTSGQTYTFRLVVTLTGNSAQIAGEPLVVTL